MVIFNKVPGQATRRHPEWPPYRCFLSDLTGFGGFCRAGPTRTADGVRITLEANIELADDLSTAMSCGAEGIGLYRSEFLLAGAPPDAAARSRSS